MELSSPGVTRLPSRVRPMGERDVPGVVALAARVPTAPHWPLPEFIRMLAVTVARPQRRGAWVAVPASDEETVHEEALSSGQVLGFAIGSHAVGDAELEAVVTAPEHRRQGLGGALLDAVITWSRTVGAKRLLLEARVSNMDAARLYGSRGFVQDGVRRGYYRSPEEDAMLLSLELGGETPRPE